MVYMSANADPAAIHADELAHVRRINEAMEMNRVSSRFLSAERRRAIARLRQNGVPTWEIARSCGLSRVHVSVLTHQAKQGATS